MLDFLTFTDTGRLVLCLLVFISFYYITKLFFAMVTKRKYIEVTLKKNTKLSRTLKKVRPLKMLLLNVTY